MRILVVPDKFKGTLTAEQAAAIIGDGWRSIRPSDEIRFLPMSDGGDGFGAVMSRIVGAEVREVNTTDAAGRPCISQWWFDRSERRAIIESAGVIGLAMLPKGQFHPFDLDTRGLGTVIRAAVKEGATRCIIGIGGSATNDGGFGLARALGWEFLDRGGKPIDAWTSLKGAVKVVPPKRRRWFRSCVVAVDVQNRLLGKHGATRVYGPQKGIRPGDIPRAEAALGRLARLITNLTGRNLAREPGTGAAGGLGFGLRAFLGGELCSGFDLFARQANLEQHLAWADLVITGEGRIDASTLMGKGVGQIAKQCRKTGVPCIGLGGHVGLTAHQLAKGFVWALGLTDLTDREKALANPGVWLQKLAATAACLSPVA